ncbi:MAG: DUF1667 domain-containing protein [Clostridia bacterium]|nr:DUF1667 domain-containing protein [Clostridia bacterium]
MTQLVCIVCPNGCRLTINNDGENIEVLGGKCPKGKAYAVTEMTNPTRSVTTTVKTVFPEAGVLPVRTNGEIPKAKIFDFMKVINCFVLDKRVKRGEVVLQNVLDSGIDVIATSNMLQK